MQSKWYHRVSPTGRSAAAPSQSGATPLSICVLRRQRAMPAEVQERRATHAAGAPTSRVPPNIHRPMALKPTEATRDYACCTSRAAAASLRGAPGLTVGRPRQPHVVGGHVSAQFIWSQADAERQMAAQSADETCSRGMPLLVRARQAATELVPSRGARGNPHSRCCHTKNTRSKKCTGLRL
jgi:hypothetical protein